MRRFVPPAWATTWGVCVLFALLAVSIPLPSYQLEYIRIKDRLGVPLWVIVYIPDPAKFQRAPAAVVCQPINDSPEYGRMMDLELVKDGFVVLTFNWRGRAPEENRQLLRERTQETLRADLTAAVAYLRSMPEVDPDRIVLAGHSVGGSLVIETGMADPKIAAVASIGMDADVTLSEPRNLLWAVGLYDEFREGLDHMRGVFRESASTDAREDTTVGDFARGTARRLGVSPTSDHFTELQDRGIHREVLNWFRRAVGLPDETRGLRMEARGLLLVVAWLAAIAGLFLTFRRFACGRLDRVRILRAAAAAALLGMALLCRVRGLGFLQAGNGVFVFFVFAFFAGHVSSLDPVTFERAWRFGARAGLVFWASLLATFVANNIPYYIETPRYLVALPEFAVRHLLDLADGYVLNYSHPILFSIYDSQQLVLRWWVYVVMIAVIIVPDWLNWLVARLRRPRRGERVSPRRARAAASRARISPASVIVLVLLLMFLASVVSLRLAQGFLTGDSARAALQFMLRFTVLPIFLFALLWRITRLREVAKTEEGPELN
jgi:alpha/beta superfamily hydrolase